MSYNILCPECKGIRPKQSVCILCEDTGYCKGIRKLILEIDYGKLEELYEGDAYKILGAIQDTLLFELSYLEHESGTITTATIKDRHYHAEGEEVLAYFRIVETPEA